MTHKSKPFETLRPRLWGVAYRMLGSVADTEDAIQDNFVKWQNADQSKIVNTEAWLVTVCTRRCIDLLRTAKSSRIDYVGIWLPEPVGSIGQPGPNEQIELASSLSTAFLVVLEQLTPVERAAFLLRDIFDYPYQDIAVILDKSTDACRQIVSRAKKRIGNKRADARIEDDHQRELLETFLDALRSGDTKQLERMLADDVELWSDGGGKVPAALNVIKSADKVIRFLEGVWRQAWHQVEFVPHMFNGSVGLLIRHEGRIYGTISLSSHEDGQCSQIFVVRNPEKLTHLTVH